jgi:hypothetical protein
MFSNLFFYIRYNIYINAKKIFSPKRREYVILFLGRYPDNFKHGFKAILDSNSLLKYSIGSACIVVRFDSLKKIKEIQQTLNRVYDGYMDSFLLFEVNDNNYVKTLGDAHYKHLYDKSTTIKSIDSSLNKVQGFIDIISKMRQEFIDMLTQQLESGEIMNNEPSIIKEINADPILTMDDIDPILEKIKDFGIKSLTKEEELILKKYTKNG